MLAKELAGKFYEQKRSGRFRAGADLVAARRIVRDENGNPKEVVGRIPFAEAYPNAKAYVEAWWPFFVVAARRCLVEMLAMPDTVIRPTTKERIMDALIEDREKDVRGQGRRLLQIEANEHGQ